MGAFHHAIPSVLLLTAGRVSALPIDEKAGRLPIAAIAENVINAHGFAGREQ
jgi:hypothetical protein